MKRPSTATIAVFVAILLVTAAIVVGVGLGTDGATAIRVGDDRVSREQLNDELRQWASFEESQARATAGAVTNTAGTTIATRIVWELLANQYLARVGERVTGADRTAAREAVAESPEFAALPRWFRDTFVERQATFNALTRLVGEDEDATVELAVLRREARRAGVTVDPAYGRYVPSQLQVVPYPTPFTSPG